jgi:hypothetical protein
MAPLKEKLQTSTGVVDAPSKRPPFLMFHSLILQHAKDVTREKDMSPPQLFNELLVATMNPVFSTTGNVLVAIALRPDSRIRDIASELNVTDRTVIISIAQLVEGGFVSVERAGRRNRYHVDLNREIHCGRTSIKIHDLIELIQRAM